MRRKLISFVAVILIFACMFSPASQANLPTFDAANAALNEIRNALMQSQFAQDIALAMERLNQFKAQYLETLRFNSGVDDLLDLVNGNPFANINPQNQSDVQQAFWDFRDVATQSGNIERASGAVEIRRSLEAVTGAIPESSVRPYIPFEEMQVVDGFKTAQAIRSAGDDVRNNARIISEQSRSASPKGAARLGADALSRIIVQGQESQEALAKIIELQATQVEQVSRDEKRLESERAKYLNDAKDYLQAVLTGGSI